MVKIVDQLHIPSEDQIHIYAASLAAGGYTGSANALLALLQENQRLNKWADDFSAAQLKERKCAEDRIAELERVLLVSGGR